MNNKYKELHKDWEKIIFSGTILVLFILFVIFVINTFFADDNRNQSSVAAAPHHSLFNENAFAFLAGVTRLDEDEIPFNYRKPFRKPRIKRPPRKHTGPKPKPEKKGHIVYYNGWVNLKDSDQKIAFIKIRDFKTGKVLKSDSVKKNDEIFDYTVLNIDDEKINIVTPDGEYREIPIHKNIKIIQNE